MNVGRLQDNDIEDIINKFRYGAELIKGFYDNGHISDSQIQKYELGFINESNDEDWDEEFPGKIVKNLEKIKKRIRDRFLYYPNRFIERQEVKWEPSISIDEDKKNYTNSMYSSRRDSSKCFCQMCGKVTYEKYIERNDIQKNLAMHGNRCI